jgi:hypothetical protein
MSPCTDYNAMNQMMAFWVLTYTGQICSNISEELQGNSLGQVDAEANEREKC